MRWLVLLVLLVFVACAGQYTRVKVLDFETGRGVWHDIDPSEIKIEAVVIHGRFYRGGWAFITYRTSEGKTLTIQIPIGVLVDMAPAEDTQDTSFEEWVKRGEERLDRP